MYPRRRFTRNELNYLRMVYIVVKIFPKILLQIFKTEWRRWTKSRWNDDKRSVKEFWSRESRSRDDAINKSIDRGDSSQFDSTVLFYLILNSDSVGQKIRHRDRTEVCELRKLRNEVVHCTEIEVPTRKFDSFFTDVCRCFRTLRFATKELQDVKTTVFFDEEGERLRRKVEEERRRLKEYEDYFSWRNSKFEEFSRKYNKQRISPRELKRKGILSTQEVDKIESQKDEKLKNAMIVDCVLLKGHDNTTAFLNTLHQTDSGLVESFANTLPHKSLTAVTIASPESIQKATCQYPKNYTTIMLEFTEYIYSMDWDAMDRRGQEFLDQSVDWSAKLFVMIELAYGYNVRGDSKKAIALLEEVTQNAFRAGPNCTRILSRAFSRKSLHYIHVRQFATAKSYATEANCLIHNLQSPEEEMVGLKRITDCILYEDGSVAERRQKSWSSYGKMIGMCREHIEDIPRCRYYLRFIYHDMARLCLGFTKDGFVESTLDEIQEGEKYIKRLEEPDLETSDGNTYTDGFRFICKSVAAFKRWKLLQDEEEKRKMLKEGFEHKCKATAICESLKIDNNEAMFMLTSLNEYVSKWQIK